MRRRETGAPAAQAARHAPQLSGARSVAAAHRRGQDRGGPRVRFREDRVAEGRGSRYTPEFHVRVDKAKLRKAELRDGHYLLRSNLTGDDPAVLWYRYVQLTQIEAVFRREERPGSAPDPSSTGAARRRPHPDCVPGLLPAGDPEEAAAGAGAGADAEGVLEKLATIQMIDVCIPTTDGRWLILPRYTQPTPEQQILLHTLKLNLPAQPPPRIQVRGENQPVQRLRL